LTLPEGGTIAEGFVTDNPTIELTPASPDDSTQKLVIKGGLPPEEPTDYHLHLTTGDLETTSIILGTDEHNVRTTVDGGIQLNSQNYNTNEQHTLIFDNNGNLKSADNSTLQILSTGSNGAVGMGWSSNIDNPENIALVIVNSPGGTSEAVDIVVGTLAEPNIWTFDPNGALTIPGDIRSEGNINIDINLSDSTLRRWTFGEDGDLKFPDATVQTTAYPGLPAYINYFDFASESVTTFITDPAVYTKLNTDTTAGFSRNGLTATNNRVTNTSSNAKVVKLEAILSFIPATSDFINVSAAFFQNDTIIPCSEQKALTGVALQNEITVLPFHCVTQLDPGDYVEVWINNLTDETAIKLDNINVIITEF
jgi:hypothetical protein